ncbi:MAG: hypothetical protein PVH85_31855 [Desulfobacterales bacterium]
MLSYDQGRKIVSGDKGVISDITAEAKSEVFGPAKKQPQMVCAWCSKFIVTKARGAGPINKSSFFISHGICPDCARKLLEQEKEENNN